jgi:hypothetical protein
MNNFSKTFHQIYLIFGQLNKLMIVNHVNAPPTNTDQLSDVEAMITEKSEELRKLCFDNNRQCVILVDAKGRRSGTFLTFWNLREKYQVENSTDIIDANIHADAFNKLLTGLNTFIGSLTNGKLGIGHLPPPNE